MPGPLANERHERFCQEMAKGTSQHKAYLAAGYVGGPPKASRIADKPAVKARIAELLGGAAEKAQIDVARVLAELGKIGFSDIRKLFDDAGRLKHITMLDDDAAACIQSIEVDAVKRRQAKGGEERDELEAEATLKIKLWDKRAALVDIGKHLGMFKEGQPDPPQINVNVGDSELARLIVFQLTKATKAAD